MAFIPAANVARAELVFYTEPGNVMENVLHYQFDTGPTEADMLDLGADLIDIWNDNLAQHVSNYYTLGQVRVTDLSSELGLSLEVATTEWIHGTNTGAALPGNVTLSFTLRTQYRGRSFRGRIYHIGLTEGQVVGDKVDTQVVGALNVAYLNFMTPGGLANPKLVVLSKYHNNAARQHGVATVVTSISTDGLIDSQRRRLTRR